MLMAKKRSSIAEIEEVPETLRVYCWRHEQLERAGYPVDIAVMLAERSDVDLHAACALLKRGATLHDALRILT